MTFRFQLLLLHLRRRRRRSIDSRRFRASENSERRQRTLANRRVDRLSALPDEILICILSLLNTKDAVATSILSTRWKNLFLFVRNINLEDSFIRGNTYRGCVLNFAMFGIRQVMLRTVGQINQFRLRCDLNFDDFPIQTLIRVAISHDIKEMEIVVSFNAVSGILPAEVFTSKLVVLKLFGAAYLGSPDSISLPNLKVLHLEEIFLSSCDTMKTFFASCPKLEELCLSSLYGAGNFILYLSMPFLKRFSFDFGKGVPGFELSINTPNVEHFGYKGAYKKFQVLAKFNALVRAELNFVRTVQNTDGLSEFIQNLRGVESIYMSWYALQAAYPIYNFNDEEGYEVFENVSKMEVGAVYGLVSLFDVLEAAPRLEFLIIHWSGNNDLIEEEQYNLPEVPPLCFYGNLKAIEFKEFLGKKKWEVELVKYFINRVTALEMLKIATSSYVFAGGVTREEISDLPKKSSKKCNVVFENHQDAGTSTQQ